MGSATNELVAFYERVGPASEIAPTFNPGSNDMIVAGKTATKTEIIDEEAPCSENEGHIRLLFEPMQPGLIDGDTADSEDAPSGPKHFCAARRCS